MAVQPLASQVGVAPACRALGVPRASFYRRQRPAPGHRQPRPTPARALCASERAHVLDMLASPRFVDRSPAEVVATLLDEGRYLCAERTMYRILAANQPVRERAISAVIPATPSPSWWPRAPTRPGPGTSPGSELGSHRESGQGQANRPKEPDQPRRIPRGYMADGGMRKILGPFPSCSRHRFEPNHLPLLARRLDLISAVAMSLSRYAGRQLRQSIRWARHSMSG